MERELTQKGKDAVHAFLVKEFSQWLARDLLNTRLHVNSDAVLRWQVGLNIIDGEDLDNPILRLDTDNEEAPLQ